LISAFWLFSNAVGCIEFSPFIFFSFHAFLKQVVYNPFTFYLTLKVYTPCPDMISYFPLAQGVECRFFQRPRSTGFGCCTEDLDKLIFLRPSANLHRMSAGLIRVNIIITVKAI
jgi:hypothetical protein